MFMTATDWTPLISIHAVTGLLFFALVILTFCTLAALGKYLTWLSLKDHPIIDKVLRQACGQIQPPYLLRLGAWLAAWMMVAMALKAIL